MIARPPDYPTWSTTSQNAWYATNILAVEQQSQRAAWTTPQPISTSISPVQPLAPDLLPKPLRDYVFDIADRQQSPVDFAAITAICALSALAGNRVRIRPKQFDDWTIVPNLWGAIIGPPSAMKSPALKASLPPLYGLQDEMRQQWEAAKREAAIEKSLTEISAKDRAKKARKLIEQGNTDEARRVLNKTTTDGQAPSRCCPRLIVNDATVEKLGELLNENPRGLLLIRDELSGFIARMGREEAQGERTFYLEAYNGDSSFTYDRISRGTIHIACSTLAIIGGIQPSRLAPLVRGALNGTTDDGLIQRFQLAVWPDPSVSWVWTDRRPNAAARRDYESSFRALHKFTRDLREPEILTFDPAAQEMFRTWITENQTEARGGNMPSSLESHLLKMPETVCSLALLFHLVEGGYYDGQVSEQSTARALDWGDYLKSHARRLYSSGSIQIEQGALLILERRGQLPEKFTARDVQRKVWAGISDKEAVADAIELLIAHGYCRDVPIATTTGAGRPTILHEWNPLLIKGEA